MAEGQQAAAGTIATPQIVQTESTAHVLQNRYCFWYMRRGQAKRTENYEKSIKLIGTFNTVRRALRVLAVPRFVDDALRLGSGRIVLEHLLAHGPTGRPSEHDRLPPFQRGHQADLGGAIKLFSWLSRHSPLLCHSGCSESSWGEVDGALEEGSSVAILGRAGDGHRGGAV